MKRGLCKKVYIGLIAASVLFTPSWSGQIVNADNVVITKDNDGMYTATIGSDLADGQLYESLYERIVLTDEVNSVGKYAFANSHELKEVVLSDNIKKVENGLCYGCEKLSSVNLLNVKEIGNSAFYNCIKLKTVKFSNDLMRIGTKAFEGCESLNNIDIPKGVVEIENDTFNGCTSLKDIKLNAGLEKIDKNAFKGCSSLFNVEIPKSVNYISVSAFAECSEDMVIVAAKGSYAYEYAEVNGIKVSETKIDESEKNKISISKAKVTLDSSVYYYDGKKHAPKVTVKMGDTVLKQGVDYNIMYTGNMRPGTWKAQVLGEGKYKGSQSKKFKIMVTPVKYFTLKNVKNKSIRIRSRKLNVRKNITGYQIAYKKIKDQKFKRVKVFNTGKLDYVLDNLKKRATYQIKIRCFVKTNGRNSYSTWSGVKQVKIKK